VQQARVQTQVEESLRLTSLPGEDQGRLYCIRRLRLPPFNAHNEPTDWNERCGRRLIEAAHSAVHAIDPRAAHADVVFFDDAQQPFRLLIERLLAGDAAREWFWPRATGVEFVTPNRLAQTLDRWRTQPGGWACVARTLLPTIDSGAARALVETISPTTARTWLTPFATERAARTPDRLDPPVRVSSRRLLDDVRGKFGSADSRVLFFAVLAVLEASPAMTPDIETLRSVVDRADDDARHAIGGSAGNDRSDLGERDRGSVTPVTPDSSPTVTDSPTQRVRHDRERRVLRVNKVALGESVPNEPTDYAGFYFLLNVLRHLDVEAALSANPELLTTHFVSRVLLRTAMTCGIGVDDPILQPLVDDMSELPAKRPADPVVVPAMLAGFRRLHPSADISERLWLYAVRRWCRRIAHVRAGDIVKRPGRIRQTPASIDVTMPMSAVELDIRRAGLDINPGYVLWFGRVVHFHYVEGEPYERRSAKH
jgi:hypothetical protein